jgi:membrane protein DedA with SNARE-associated domain
LSTLSALLAQHGLSIVFINVLLSQLGLPLPAVPMLIVAGALVADGALHLIPLALAILAGSLLGDLPWFYAGRRYGYRVLRTLCRVSIEPDTCVKQTENIFSRWGAPSLVVAKYIPGFSTVAPPLAGTMGVAAPRFLAYSSLAALLWAAAPVSAGFFLSEHVDAVIVALEGMGATALAIIAAVVAVYVAIKAIERYLLIRMLRMVRIRVSELQALLASAAPPVVLDVRSSLAREAEPRRIPGAIVAELAAAEQVLRHVPPDRDVVVYCS